MKFYIFAKSALLTCIALAVNAEVEAQETVFFNFTDAAAANTLNGQAVIEADPANNIEAFNPTISATNGTDTVTLTVTALETLEYNTAGTGLTGETVPAELFVATTFGRGLGVDNVTATDAQSEVVAMTPNTREENYINGGEFFRFTFDTDVKFTQIDFGDIGNNSDRVGTDGQPAIGEIAHVFIEGENDGQPFIFGNGMFLDMFDDPFDGLVISAGTEISFSAELLIDAYSLNSFTVEVVGAEPLLGDANLDGMVDFSDIASFISILSMNEFLDEADIDRNNMVDFSDIGPFIGILAGT